MYEEERGLGYEPVLFRHGDSDVMMLMLPVLDPKQIERLFGAAREIILDAPGYSGCRVFEKPSDQPNSQRGMLRITQEQYEMIKDDYVDYLRNRAVREFEPRFETPAEADRLRIEAAFDRADGYGMETKVQIWDYIELDIENGARLEQTSIQKIMTSDTLDGFEKLQAAKAALRKTVES